MSRPAKPIPAHEAALIREHYATKGAQWCADQLGLTWRQVIRRVKALRIRRRQPWTHQADQQLRWAWGAESVQVIASKIGRTPNATYARAKILGLGLGCPRGYAYLNQIAVECGYAPNTMQRILRWAGVWVRRGPTRPDKVPRGTGKHEYTTWIADHASALEAVDRWHQHETLHAAGERTGIDDEVLARWLAEDGRAGQRPARKRRWYVPIAVVDDVVAKQLAAETIADAARRLAVSHGVVRRRLEDAGVVERGVRLRHGYRYPVEVIDLAFARAA